MKTFDNAIASLQMNNLLNLDNLTFEEVLAGDFFDELKTSLNWAQYIAKLNSNLDEVDTLCGITTAQIPTSGKGINIRNAINLRINTLNSCLDYSNASQGFLSDFGNIIPDTGNPILSKSGTETHATFASVLKVDSTFYMYYYDGLSISLATSIDGRSWQKYGSNPVLLRGVAGAWDDERIWCANVWIEDDIWYMTYAGRKDLDESLIGLATSVNGINWTKYVSNPIITPQAETWEEEGLEIWGLIKVGLIYYAFIDIPSSANRKIGVVTSTDLITWTRDENNPIFETGRFCVCPIKFKDYYYLMVMHYTVGTDYAEIELYRDSNPTFYSTDREFLGVIKEASLAGWDGVDADTPFVVTDDIHRDSFNSTNGELWIYYSGNSTTWAECLLKSRVINI